MNRQGIDEFCSIDCMIQYFTEIINYDHECMRTESIIEDIIERAFEAGQLTCECDV